MFASTSPLRGANWTSASETRLAAPLRAPFGAGRGKSPSGLAVERGRLFIVLIVRRSPAVSRRKLRTVVPIDAMRCVVAHSRYGYINVDICGAAFGGARPFQSRLAGHVSFV